MRSLLLFGLFLAGLLSTTAAEAKVLFTYNREHRMAVWTADQGDNANNAVVRETTLSNMPDYFRTLLYKMVTECSGVQDIESHVKTYEYVSDRNRRMNLAPSYIVDFSPMKGEKLKTCDYMDMCSAEGCMLLGYIADERGTWDQGFQMPVWEWRFASQAPAAGGPAIGMISTKELADSCESRGGTHGDSVCNVTYTWQVGGLVPARAP